MLRHTLYAIALALPLIAVGCASPPSGDEAEGESGEAITGSVAEGTQYSTTARLNLRTGPSTSEDVIRTLASGAIVTIVDGDPQNGFYHVESGGDDGWVFGSYLTDGSKAKKVGSVNPPTDPGAAKSGTGQVETCKASFYTEGQKTANGETFNTNALTAAHKTLPFNTIVKVTNTSTGKSVNVRINDRGPFVSGRCIDLSRAAFGDIASLSAGVASVTVEVLK
jgi:rare lipoprotein A